jgi:hypothetical protein
MLFPVLAAGAAAVLVGKALARHWNGELARSAVNDPKGVRTVARFATEAPIAVLEAVAAEVKRVLREQGSYQALAVEVTADAVRTCGIDVVRLASAEHAYTLTLTRAWTGPQLDARATELLEQLHAVLAAHPGVVELGWHARQDRELADRRAYPFDP